MHSGQTALVSCYPTILLCIMKRQTPRSTRLCMYTLIWLCACQSPNSISLLPSPCPSLCHSTHARFPIPSDSTLPLHLRPPRFVSRDLSSPPSPDTSPPTRGAPNTFANNYSAQGPPHRLCLLSTPAPPPPTSHHPAISTPQEYRLSGKRVLPGSLLCKGTWPVLGLLVYAQDCCRWGSRDVVTWGLRRESSP